MISSCVFSPIFSLPSLSQLACFDSSPPPQSFSLDGLRPPFNEKTKRKLFLRSPQPLPPWLREWSGGKHKAPLSLPAQDLQSKIPESHCGPVQIYSFSTPFLNYFTATTAECRRTLCTRRFFPPQRLLRRPSRIDCSFFDRSLLPPYCPTGFAEFNEFEVCTASPVPPPPVPFLARIVQSM